MRTATRAVPTKAVNNLKVKEIFCKSALVKSQIPGVDYALNPYLGCEHKCLYCYASFMQKYTEHKERWGDFVDVKINLLERLSQQIKRNPQRIKQMKRINVADSKVVMLSSVTDPYQPVEEKFRLTRGCLEILAGTDFSVSIQTKSDLVLRDLDIIKRLKDVEVGFTITTLDEEIRRKFEPRASSVEQRIKALEILGDNKISAFVFFGPILPYFSDDKEVIKSLLNRLNKIKVSRVYLDKLNYKGRNWERIERFLLENYPKLIKYYQWTKNCEKEYAQMLKMRIEEATKNIPLVYQIVF